MTLTVTKNKSNTVLKWTQQAEYIFSTWTQARCVYKSIFKNSVTTFIMDHKYSIDIDNLLEFQIAEFIRTKYKS